jgi:pyruvate dehydrogenase E1 component alpha subunit
VLLDSRTRDEIQEVRQTRDPITGFREKLVASGLADQDELKAIEVRKKDKINAQFF